MRRVRSWTEAVNGQQRADARVCSKSFARRRLRPSQAKVRSTTQRRGTISKPLRPVGPFDDLDGPLPEPGEATPELLPGIAAIGEDVPQPWERADDLGQQQRSTATVLDIGDVDHGMDQITFDIGHDMTLAPLDLFTRIIAPRTSAFGRRDALAVDYTGTGRSLTALGGA